MWKFARSFRFKNNTVQQGQLSLAVSALEKFTLWNRDNFFPFDHTSDPERVKNCVKRNCQARLKMRLPLSSVFHSISAILLRFRLDLSHFVSNALPSAKLLNAVLFTCKNSIRCEKIPSPWQ